MPLLDIAFPVWNEENRLERGVHRAVAWLETSPIPEWCLTIAENGSSDRTREIGLGLQQTYSGRVRFVSAPAQGVGGALKQAWSTSQGDLVGYMDIDLATDLPHLATVYELLQDSRVDIVNGSRLLPGSEVHGRSYLRETTSRVFNGMLRVLAGAAFTDGMCGFKFLKRAALDQILALGIPNDGWFFCTELLVKAQWLGLGLREIPVHWTDDDDTRVHIPTLALRYTTDILRIRREHRAFLRQSRQ
jgi:glycosyltransferase involved in cell wall biosynthesis